MKILAWRFLHCKNCFRSAEETTERLAVGLGQRDDAKYLLRVACLTCGAVIVDADSVQALARNVFKATGPLPA